MANNIYVVVARQHRCGSTVLAGILRRLGLYMGEVDNSIDEWQPGGWEIDRSLEFFCNNLFYNLQDSKSVIVGDNDNQLIIPDINYKLPRNTLSAVYSLLEERDAHGDWGIRSMYGPIIAKNLSEIGRDVYPIIIDRPLEESQQSYYDRVSEGHKPYAFEYIAKWREMTGQFKWFGKKLEINFADIFEDTDNTVDKIANFIELPTNNEAKSWVNPDWRRY